MDRIYIVAALALLLLAAPTSHNALAQNTGKRDGLYTPPDTAGLERWRGNGGRNTDDPFDDDFNAARSNSKSSVAGPAVNAPAGKAVNGWIFGRSERLMVLPVAALALVFAMATAVYFWRRYSNRMMPAELAMEIVRENPSSRRLERPSEKPSHRSVAPRKAA